MFSNFTEETCTGIGDTLELAGATAGHIPFSASFADGDLVSYVVEDSGGSIKVAGIGTYVAATDDITRNDTWNYNGTVVDKNPSTNITLSGGTHTIRCDMVGAEAQKAYDAEYGYGFSAISTTGSEPLPSATWTAITGATFDSVEYNKDSVFSNGVFTPSKTGIYLITGIITARDLEADEKMIVAIYKNGVLYRLLGRGTSGGVAADYAGYGGAAQVVVDDITDTYDLRVYQGGAATNTVGNVRGYNTFSAIRIGDV